MKRGWIWIVAGVFILIIGYVVINGMKLSYSGTVGTTPTPSFITTTPSAVPQATGSIISTQTGAKGDYLVGTNGMSLYIFDKDTTGVSNCSGSCAGLWPPYATASVPATLPTGVSTITRSDGTFQFTYQGMPLYYYTGDTSPGDVNGDGVSGIWHLVKP